VLLFGLRCRELTAGLISRLKAAHQEISSLHQPALLFRNPRQDTSASRQFSFRDGMRAALRGHGDIEGNLHANPS